MKINSTTHKVIVFFIGLFFLSIIIAAIENYPTHLSPYDFGKSVGGNSRKLLEISAMVSLVVLAFRHTGSKE
jgi:hypothetical protein